MCRWTMKHHSLAVDFSSLDFEKIDIEISQTRLRSKKKLKLMPWKKILLLKEKTLTNLLFPFHSFLFFFFYLENNGCPLVLGFYLSTNNRCLPVLGP